MAPGTLARIAMLPDTLRDQILGDVLGRLREELASWFNHWVGVAATAFLQQLGELGIELNILEDMVEEMGGDSDSESS